MRRRAIFFRNNLHVGLRKQKLTMEAKARKVLIADDEPDILEILKYNLVNEGYQVITAKDGDGNHGLFLI